VKDYLTERRKRAESGRKKRETQDHNPMRRIDMTTKAALAERLEAAISLLNEVAEHPRLPNKSKAEIFSFVDEVKSGLSESAPGAGTIYRVAEVVNPATSKTAVVPVRKDGSHSARFSHMEPASEWVEVRASSWAAATAAVKAGEGVTFTAPEKAPKTPKKAPKKPRKRSRAKAEAPSEVEAEA
jgi:hypothetical protein